MAEARLKKKDKQYEQLVQGSNKLHRDIENLESAYLLHRQLVEDDQNNVRAIIRKEVGGPRWAHGGAGKLTTYKSKKDLVDQKTQDPQTENTQNLQQNQANQGSLEDNTRTKVLDGNKETFDMNLSPVKKDQILDLKTKVLKKASSYIIKRDTWSAPSDTRSVKSVSNKVSKVRTEQNITHSKNGDVNADTSITKPHKPVRRSNSLKRETNESSRSPTITAQRSKENKQKRIKAQAYKKETNKTVNEHSGVQSQRRSRIDVFKDNEQNPRPFEHSIDENSRQNGQDSDENKGNKSGRTIGVTFTPRKLQTYADKIVENGASSGIFPTQPPEPREIYIDPRKGQVRILAGKEESFNDISSLEGTRVLVQPGSLHNSVDGNKLACSVVDDTSNSSPRREIRDIFGLEDFNTRPDSRNRQQVTSTSPFATTRQCNTEVEFWLRSLGIPDVDRYVRIFADNEIDLTDLEFMSASQLHDMGVTTFGALDRILKGIRDLKSQPVTQMENSGGNDIMLQTSSIAWEDINPIQKKKIINEKSNLKASKVVKGNSCHSESFVLGCKDTDNERCSSAMSNGINSERSETPSFAASTKSSSAKCMEKRPPSAKTTTGVKSKGNSNQSQNRNVNSSVAKLRRSNSAASEKPVSKLTNMEVKPTKGVLIRPRSSSLTRESCRSGREIQGKKVEEKKEPRQLRSRSRSADVVKRKALEGVHAAAKKFEDKKMKTKDADKSYPPCDEKKKLRRDEMAARHLQREKYKEMMVVDSGSSDTDENVMKQASGDIDNDQGLENLVTVNILSPPGKSDPHVSPSKLEDKVKTQVMKPDMRRSLRRLEQARRQAYSTVRPVELQMESDLEPPLLSTYTVSSKDRDRSHSEPESGYRTDGSTYSQIEDRVSDIQMKIKRLKARATSGDEMTLTLVHDLQEQLLHFERQLKDKERELRNQHSDPESSRANQTPRTLPANVNNSSYTSPISELLVESGMKTEEGDDEHVGAGVRMSKRELLDEMRKEKQQHHREIRQLQSELHKFRHSDPVTSLELDHRDITYKQDDLIGEGTFSCVYKGEFQGSEVAVKQLKMPLQQQDRNYFAAEVSLLKELRHPRVVLLIGVCTSSKLPLMVLEYMSQGSLFNYLHNPQCESLDHALYYQVARDIALGMNYLHSHKPEVLHLDLKSMNVLLCQSLRAKIADFGFSKLRLDAGIKSGRRGKSKSRTAAPAWMSPELLDKGEITGKSDVYSFGIILWEMLTRGSPYKDCTVFQILEMVRKNRRPEIPDGTPEGLGHLVRMCWDPNPAKRPQFKDILQILENLAFPPAWRDLFQKAGVPESALQDVQSTRTIISLVTGTLDSGKSGILHSFMVAHSEKGNKGDKKEKVETKSTFKTQKKISKKKTNSRQNSERSFKDSARSSRSSRVSSRTDDWDSDTVTSVSDKLSSDESELNLRNIRDSSSDEDAVSSDSDESSILTSDEDGIYSKTMNKQKMPKTEINVVIPNLELSLQSAREEFRAERERINRKTSDWVSVSLDDNTERSEQSGRDRTSLPADIKSDHGDMRLRLSSSLSNRSPTPPNPTKVMTSTLNESARRKRRNKGKDLNRYSDEFLMRESFDNRRPPSPKKMSLTKKFMQNSDKHLEGENVASSEDLTERSDLSNQDRKKSSAKKESYVERSYDSFFDLSVKRPVPNHSNSSQTETRISGSQIDNVDFDNSLENAKINESVTASQTRMPTGGKHVYDENEICVEDMENEVENEICMKNEHQTPKFPKSELISRISTQDLKHEGPVNKSQNLVIEEIKNRGRLKMSESVQLNNGNKSDKFGSESENSNWSGVVKTDNGSEIQRSARNKSQMPDDEKNRNGKSHELINARHKEQSSGFERTNKGYSSIVSGFQDNDIEYKSEMTEPSQVTHKDSVESKGRSVGDIKNQKTQLTNSSQEKNKYIHDKAASGSIFRMSSRQIGSSDDSIRVVLNTMLASRDDSITASLNSPVKSLDTNTSSVRRSALQSNKRQDKRQTDDIDSEIKEGNEQIRVKLDLNEVAEKKKKPAITPRRSLILSNRSTKSSEGTISEHLQGTSTQMSEQVKREDNDIYSSERNIPGDTSKSVQLFEQGECKPESRYHDSGTAPNMRSVSRHSGDNANMSQLRAETVENSKNTEVIPSPKKNTIRVKLRKDPLAQSVVPNSSSIRNDSSSLAIKPSSPIPPAPPPPPPEITRSVSLVSKSVQDNAPRGSMADELKLRLSNRKSVSEGMLQRNKGSDRNLGFRKQPQGRELYVPGKAEGEPRLVQISEMDEKLAPQQSEGLPSFVVQSLDLREQKDHLKSITRPHPHQLDDLSNASQEQLTSIADILKKAVMGRRLALGEDGDSVSQSLESAATGWSIDL